MSMPWWLGLPVLLVWGVFVAGVYIVIAVLWAIWLLGFAAANLVSRAYHRFDSTDPMVAMGSPLGSNGVFGFQRGEPGPIGAKK